MNGLPMVPYIDPRSKLLWHLDRLQELQQTGHTAAPVNVEIDLSNRCSLGCQWCHFAYTHTRGPWAGKAERPADAEAGGDLMDRTLAESILLQLSQAGVRSITWSGGGEPTLHPQLYTIVSRAYGLKLEQGMYTHGGHIDDELASLLKHALTWVYVSLDECDQDSYKTSKGIDRFQDACAGVKRLVWAKGKATIGVGFLLHKDNCNQVDEMVALGKRLGVDYIQFRPAILYSQETPGVLAEDTGWISEAIHYLRPWTLDSRVSVDLERFELYQHWMGHPYQTCHWTALQTVITPNGKVWRCVNKREHAGACLGDLTQETFAAIWKRAGSQCDVDGDCRVMCIGHAKNLVLSKIMVEPAHSSFI